MNEYDWDAKHYADDERQRRIDAAKAAHAALGYGIAPASCIPDAVLGDVGHLILTRNVGQRVIVEVGGQRVTIAVQKAACGQCKLSFLAPKSVRIDRKELYDAS